MKPEIYIDASNDFASIKIKDGVESKSYEKDGFIFCEDENGEIIEIQILNLCELSKLKEKAA